LRDRFSETFGEGEQPVRRKTPIVRLIIWAAVIIFLVILALTVPTWASTGVKEIGLHYEGGPIEGAEFVGVIPPGQPPRPVGLADEVIKLPNNQRTYIAGTSSGADSGVITATNANGNKVEFETSMTFVVPTEPEIVSSFYENICTKYQKCQGEGWTLMLDDYLRKVQETVLQGVSRSMTSEKMAQDPDALAEIGQEVNGRLAAQINRTMGGPYLEASEFQVNNLHLPERVLNEYEALTARQVETQQAAQQAKTAEELQATLENNPEYLELRRIQVEEKLAESENIEVWFYGQNTSGSVNATRSP
jgi:regulator of protease activity HflC (stomatin/prohibitin superfamily)